MKAWRKEAEAINARKAAGSKEPSARVQMQQARHFSRMFKPKGSGNWLMDALLLIGGFKDAVYGPPLTHTGDLMADMSEEVEANAPVSVVQSWVDKFKAWWNKS